MRIQAALERLGGTAGDLRQVAPATWLALVRPDAGGAAEAWLVAADGRGAARLNELARDPGRHRGWLAGSVLGPRLRSLAAASMRDPAGWEGIGELAELDRRILEQLASLADPAAGMEVLTAAEAGLRPEAMIDPMLSPRSWPAVLAAGRIELPSLFAAGPTEATLVLPLTLRNQSMVLVWLTRDGGRSCLRLAVRRTTPGAPSTGCAWLPEQNRLIVADPPSPVRLDGLRTAIARACALLLALPDAARRRLPEPARGFALFMPASAEGGPHLGHALWDELGALDRALDALPAGSPPPQVWHTTEAWGAGARLFGPVEDLYPELEGRVRVAESPAWLLEATLAAGLQVFPVMQRRAQRATRTRIGRVVAAEAARSGLAREAAALAGEGADRLPVIAFGLRLMNRRPVDLAGFYARLAGALAARIGPFVAVLDGLNGAESGAGAAAMIYHAGSRHGRHISDGSAEMAAEAAFAAAFAESVAGCGVRTVSCVGMRMLPNLFWLSQAGFFVAPSGAGLAKLRWALDVPGFVLAGRANLEWLTLLTIYGDARWMEPPFAPLHYTTPAEVEDRPADPSLRPTRHISIPWPDNFVFTDEAALIARICGLAERHLRAPAPPG